MHTNTKTYNTLVSNVLRKRDHSLVTQQRNRQVLYKKE